MSKRRALQVYARQYAMLAPADTCTKVDQFLLFLLLGLYILFNHDSVDIHVFLVVATYSRTTSDLFVYKI